MPLITLFIILIGLAVGSFLNVCIFRIPKGQSVVLPVSSCRVCGARLHFLDIIPLVSYLLLRGRCHYCRAEFSPRYAVVEALTAGLFVLCYEVFGLSALYVKAFVFVSFLIIITFIDFDHQLIFDKVLLWLAPLGVILNLLFSGPGIIDMLIAALAGGGLLLVIAVVSRGGMGGGDVKFVAALGLWLGVKLLIVCLLLTFIIGGLGGAALLALKLKGRKDAIPFGPFIAVGALLSMLYGQKLIFWYLGLLY
jgi:leader peptidase (prepilin peptidase)/N-methyltransferase